MEIDHVRVYQAASGAPLAWAGLPQVPPVHMRQDRSILGGHDDGCTSEGAVAHLAGWRDRGAVQLHRGVRLRDEHGAGRQVPGQRGHDAGSDRPLPSRCRAG
ncbi:MAG: hypothetical protein M0C28_30955 [Candidatus Moduliflexus flocculans]|nr:hypothetical protein [Candidatus Moduliflexus flocculans]